MSEVTSSNGKPAAANGAEAPEAANPTAEKARIVEVLGQHLDVNSDHAMHGWSCSCGWGAPSGPPPWTRHTHDAFLAHVAHMLLQPTPTNSPEASATASQGSDPDRGWNQIEAMARAIAEAADDACFDRIDAGESDESTGDWEDANYYRRLAQAAHDALVVPPDQRSV